MAPNLESIHTIHVRLGRAHRAKAKLLGSRGLRHLAKAKLAHSHTQPLNIAGVALMSLASSAKSSSVRADGSGRGDRGSASGSLGFSLLSFRVIPQFLNALCLLLGLALHLIEIDITGNDLLGSKLGRLLRTKDTALLGGGGCGGLANCSVCANGGRSGSSWLVIGRGERRLGARAIGARAGVQER